MKPRLVSKIKRCKLLHARDLKIYQKGAEVEKEIKPQLDWAAATLEIRSKFLAIQAEAIKIEQTAPLIRFDEQRGTFMISLGAISKTTIASARTALKQIQQCLDLGDMRHHAIAGQFIR